MGLNLQQVWRGATGEEALPNAVSTAQMQALGEAPFKGQSSPLGAGESVAPRVYVSPLYHKRRTVFTQVRWGVKDRLEEKKEIGGQD